MDFDSLKIISNKLSEKIQKIESALKIKEKYIRLNELEQMTMQNSFFDDSKTSAKILGEMKNLKTILEKQEKLNNNFSDFECYLELGIEANDEESFNEALKLSKILEKKLDKLEIDTLLSDEYDSHNSIITIHPGAGRYRVTRLG